MAQIIVTATPVNLNVSTTQSNITVTDVETNVTVNVASLSSNIAVTSTPVNVTISPSIGVSNAEIRAALSATTPIVYDNNTGEFTFDPSANNMQVTSLTASGFVTTTGNLTSSGLSVSGNATVGGLLNVSNISIAGDLNANLKDISLSYYDAGNVSGNVTLDVANGPVQKIRLTNNLTGLTFTGATAAQPITLIIQQDNVGFWTLDTSTFASNWTNWLFTSNFKTLSTTANATDLLSITYNGTSYFASLVNFVQTLITNAELANSNVVVNGTTINLGSSGNISHFGALTTTNLAEGTNLYFSAARVRGNVSAATPLTYNSSTGEFGFADFAQIGGLNVNSTQGYSGVSLRVNKYTGGGNPNAMDVIGNATVSERLTVTGNVQGNFFIGNGSQLTGVTTLTNAQVIANIATQPLTVGGNLTVNGNINATGNINVQNVEDLYVRDQTIVMNANAASPANVQIVSNRPGSANTEIKWNEQTDRWTFTNDGSTYYNLPTSTTDVAEGTNLYYTTDRANTAIGAYQGDINTPGTITAGISNATTVNATTVNVTDLNATNNVTVLGKLNAADGSNIQYVRAYSADLVTDSGANGLNVILESQSNNRLAKASSDSIRYVPDTRTLLVTDGTIGSSAANTSFSGNSLFLSGNIIAGNISVNTVTAGSLSGNGTLITAITGANVFGLVTTQVSEGTNLYYTTDRANTAIANYQGNINTAGNIQGNYILGNGSQLTGIPANIAGSENITITGNVVSLDNALSNVYSITTTTGTNLTLNTDNKLVVTQNFAGRQVGFSGNIAHDGYAFFTGGVYTGNAVTSYSGTANIEAYIFDTGTTTAGSNAITGVSILEFWDETPVSLSALSVNYLFTRILSGSDTYPFSDAAYVTSVDSANSTVYMSENATANLSLTIGSTIYVLRPALIDSETKQAILLVSEYDANISPRSKTVIAGSSPVPLVGKYGYPLNGWINTDFDIVTAGSNTEYTFGNLSNKFIGRNSLAAPNTVLKAPRGLVVGDADLTGRAENDVFPAFGINVLWDGLTSNVDYAGNPPSTQLLLKQYSDNSSGASQGDRNGPRLFFTTARGNKNQSFSDTYPRINNELGRISWWGATGTTSAPSSIAPPAYINSMVLQDYATHNGGTGLYFVASPHTDAARRGLFAAHHLGNTVITSSGSTNTGASQPITFAPMITALTNNATNINTSSNSLAMYNNTMAANNYQWAYINYDNASGKTGSRLSVTNGVSTVSGRNGNLVLALDRNDNGAGFGSKEWAFKLRSGQTDLVLTEDDVIRTTFAGGNITSSYFIGDGSALTNVSAIGFTNFDVSGQSTVIADTAGDTMTFVAGSGMVITTDAATDTITFSSTGGYGNAEVAAFLAAYGSNIISTTGNITAGNTIVNGVSFNTTSNIAPTSGQIRYNVDYGTHQVGLDGSNVMLMGQDLVVYARNDEATTLLKGEVVYIAGASGDKATIKRAVNNSDDNSATTIGIVKSDIAVGQLGYVVSQGVVDGLNLSGYASGDKVYLGNVAGTFTNVKPSSPEHYVFIGVVEKANAGSGQILVRVQNGFELDEIHDIKLTSVQQNDMLIRNVGNSLWVNQSVSSVVANTNVTLKQFSETTVALGSVTGDQSSNINLANGSIFSMTATGNLTISSVTNAVAGSSATLIITQDGTGGRTLTSTMKFAGASKTLSTAANAIDIISLFYDGTTYYATLSKGYA